MVLGIVVTRNVSKKPQSISINRLRHWDVHRATVYFRVGDKRYVENAQYLPEAQLMESIK